MAQWHYASGGAQTGPVTEAELEQAALTGLLAPGDMIWKQGMADWVPASRLKGLFPAGAAAAPVAVVPGSDAHVEAASYSEPQADSGAAGTLAYHSGGGGGVVTARTVELLRQTKPWVRLIAIVAFIIGGLVGVIGVVAMVGGVALGGARAGGIAGVFSAVYIAMAAFYIVPGVFLMRYASRIGALVASGRADDLESALAAQKSFWKFVGIVVAVVLAIYLGILVLVLGVGAFNG